MGCLCVKCAERGLLDDDEHSVTYGTTTAAAIIRNQKTRQQQQMPPGRSVDICGLQNTKFIIQGGTHYIEVDTLRDDLSLSDMKPLRELCKNGDHYLAECHEIRFSLNPQPIKIKNFYVIKGKSCIQVKSLSHDRYDMRSRLSDKRIFELHRKCQGGNFYCANKVGFYIIRNQDNTYLHVRNMHKDLYQSSTASRHKLHESFADGLNYFATDDYFYVLKEHVEFGLVYHRTKDLRSNTDAEVLPVSDSVASILRFSSLDQQINKGILLHNIVKHTLAFTTHNKLK